MFDGILLTIKPRLWSTVLLSDLITIETPKYGSILIFAYLSLMITLTGGHSTCPMGVAAVTQNFANLSVINIVMIW